MNDIQFSGAIGQPRKPFAPTPSYGSDPGLTQVDAPAENTAQQQGVQVDAGVLQDDADALAGDAFSADTSPSKPPEAFTVSVDEVRLRLHNHGIDKSKDTIQRYCREGSLNCQKLGLMRRYFATEESVETLIEKLQQDVPASGSMQVHADADDEFDDEMQMHAPAEDTNLVADKVLHGPASTVTQVHADERSNSSASDHVVALLNQQIDSLNGQVGFLREELVDRRQQAKALQDVIAGMKDQSKANLLNAETQAKAKGSDASRSSYTATVVKDENNFDGGGDNSQSRSVRDDV